MTGQGEQTGAPAAHQAGERLLLSAGWRLDEVAALPTAEQVPAYDEVHRLLQEALAAVEPSG